ncbi:MAG: DUF1214 domain-containing protein [Reyranella sp.]|nr:DUF1214 domain-containing protein [Reyranella sp.]
MLAATLTGTSRAFGLKRDLDPVQHLVSAAATWGGNPRRDAVHLTVTPARNDGRTVYRLDVRTVPVDAFWSISAYDAEGNSQKNDLDAWSLNDSTARKGRDGAVSLQFGGCDGEIPNCLPIMDGWNDTVRLNGPRSRILDGTWKFPEAQPAG